jgi:hypothetical protein
VDGGEGSRRLDELYKLVVVTDEPLRAVRAREGGPKRERLPVPVYVEDRGSQVVENRGGTRRGRRWGRPRRKGGREKTSTDKGRARVDGQRPTR